MHKWQSSRRSTTHENPGPAGGEVRRQRADCRQTQMDDSQIHVCCRLHAAFVGHRNGLVNLLPDQPPPSQGKPEVTADLRRRTGRHRPHFLGVPDRIAVDRHSEQLHHREDRHTESLHPLLRLDVFRIDNPGGHQQSLHRGTDRPVDRRTRWTVGHQLDLHLL